MKIDYIELVNQAILARKMSYCPYSKFAVGAALLTKDGQVVRGCNIESGTHTPTCCAERTAFFKAISEGNKDFAAIAVVGDYAQFESPREFCAPCGVCRQVMVEFCDYQTFEVVLGKGDGSYKVYTLNEVMPLKFDNLEE